MYPLSPTSLPFIKSMKTLYPKGLRSSISPGVIKVEKLSFLIANQVQFESEELTHRAFSSLGYAFENFVNMYSSVLTDTQWCTVNKAYARAFAQEDLLDKQG